MWTDRQFWLDSSWRAFRTFCQTLAAMLAGQTVNVLTADWVGMLGVAAGAALVSLLMSVDRERVVVASPTSGASPTGEIEKIQPGMYVTEAALQSDYSGDLR